MNMDKVFTNEELKKIQIMIEHIFLPIRGKVVIEGPAKVPNFGVGDWQQYKVTITGANGAIDVGVAYPKPMEGVTVRLVQYGWGIAWQLYSQMQLSLAENIRNEIEERLWPRRNGLLPDYDTLENLPEVE